MSVEHEPEAASSDSAVAQEEWADVEAPKPKNMKTCPACDGRAIRKVPALPRFPRLWRHMEKPKDTFLPCPLCKGLGVVPDLDEFAPTSAETDPDWVELEQ